MFLRGLYEQLSSIKAELYALHSAVRKLQEDVDALGTPSAEWLKAAKELVETGANAAKPDFTLLPQPALTPDLEERLEEIQKDQAEKELASLVTEDPILSEWSKSGTAREL